MSTWPDPAATVSTTDMDDDTDSLTAARADILDLTNKFNVVLGTCTQASTPWTDLNDTTLQKRISGGTTNGIVLQDASGDVIDSGKTTQTTVTDDDTKVPTSGAVVDYVDANAGGREFLATFNTTGTATIGTNTSVPAGTIRIEVLFNAVSGSGSGNIQVELGSSGPTYSVSSNGNITRDAGTTAGVSSGPAVLTSGTASDSSLVGMIELMKLDGSNVWMYKGQLADPPNSEQFQAAGLVTLVGTLTAIKVTIQSGTFDAGSVDVYVS